MPKLHGSANSDTKLTERNGGENYKPYGLQKTQNKEFLIINACYSVTKYYLCRQNNKRSLLGRKQRSQVARSFPNRYLFSCIIKVTSLFSISCISDIILRCNQALVVCQVRGGCLACRDLTVYESVEAVMGCVFLAAVLRRETLAGQPG